MERINRSSSGESGGRSGGKPDILVIVCGSMGLGQLGCYGAGAPDAPKLTPHMDRLAESGVRFTDWHSAAPVSSPSLASLLTGCWPARVGVRDQADWNSRTKGLSADRSTLGERLKEGGYRTAFFGRWHLGSEPGCHPMDRGFDEFVGFLSGSVDYYSHVDYWRQLKGGNPAHDLWWGREELWECGAYATELIAEKAAACLREPAAPDAEPPLLAWVSFNGLHWPLHPPIRYQERYRHLPEDRMLIAAQTACLDDAVGLLISALEQSGRLENTIVVLTSDHGPSAERENWPDGRGSPFSGSSFGGLRGSKGSLFDGGIKVPGIVVWPGRIEAGRELAAACCALDVVPTLLELAGAGGLDAETALTQDTDFDGESLAPLLLGGKLSDELVDRKLFWEYDGQLAVRQGRWKLVVNGREGLGNGTEAGSGAVAPGEAREMIGLFDLALDPGETGNRAGEFRHVADRLVQEAVGWYRSLIPVQEDIRDLARGKRASSSAEAIPGHEPGKAVDGDLESYWVAPGGAGAAAGDRIWTVDLEKEYTLSGTEMSLGWIGRFHFAIELSRDGGNWIPVVNKLQRTPDAQIHIDHFPPVRGRYVRVVFPPGAYPLIREFKVYGTQIAVTDNSERERK